MNEVQRYRMSDTPIKALNVDRTIAESLLTQEGDFLVRWSKNANSYVLSYLDKNLHPEHIQINVANDGSILSQDGRTEYASIEQCIDNLPFLKNHISQTQASSRNDLNSPNIKASITDYIKPINIYNDTRQKTHGMSTGMFKRRDDQQVERGEGIEKSKQSEWLFKEGDTTDDLFYTSKVEADIDCIKEVYAGELFRSIAGDDQGIKTRLVSAEDTQMSYDETNNFLVCSKIIPGFQNLKECSLDQFIDNNNFTEAQINTLKDEIALQTLTTRVLADTDLNFGNFGTFIDKAGNPHFRKLDYAQAFKQSSNDGGIAHLTSPSAFSNYTKLPEKYFPQDSINKAFITIANRDMGSFNQATTVFENTFNRYREENQGDVLLNISVGEKPNTLKEKVVENITSVKNYAVILQQIQTEQLPSTRPKLQRLQAEKDLSQKFKNFKSNLSSLRNEGSKSEKTAEAEHSNSIKPR